LSARAPTDRHSAWLVRASREDEATAAGKAAIHVTLESALAAIQPSLQNGL
jgi:hypothetical protein